MNAERSAEAVVVGLTETSTKGKEKSTQQLTKAQETYEGNCFRNKSKKTRHRILICNKIAFIPQEWHFLTDLWKTFH